MTKQKLLIVSMPFNIGVGGFIRSYNVLPGLSKLLVDRGYEIELYIPANAMRTVILNKLRTRIRNSEVDNIIKIIEDIVIEIKDELSRLVKSSGYRIFINDKVLDFNINYNLNFIKREIYHKPIFRLSELVRRFRPVFIKHFEKSFVDSVREMISKPTHAYSMHETIESIVALVNLCSKDTKVAVLMQLDLGRDLLERAQGLYSFIYLSHKAKLCGLLSVSPAPLIESHEILGLCNRIKILTPGLAVDPIFLGKSYSLKLSDTVTYYGRISKEKGILDLLKAWRIVQSKVDAKLYIAGFFEDYSTMDKFTKLITKYRLDSIRYVGHLNRTRIPYLISRFHLLAYPTYRDSFSLTVLEALCMGLRVVSYDIPAIRYIYGKSLNVELIPLADYEKLATGILNGLDEKFVYDKYTMKILEMHSSWNNVIREEFEKLCELIDYC